jgi:hypothetical protein
MGAIYGVARSNLIAVDQGCANSKTTLMSSG